jgi:hypothetical protein
VCLFKFKFKVCIFKVCLFKNSWVSVCGAATGYEYFITQWCWHVGTHCASSLAGNMLGACFNNKGGGAGNKAGANAAKVAEAALLSSPKKAKLAAKLA